MKRSTLLVLLFLTSCAPAGKLSTPTGRPEVAVRGVSAEKLKDLCAAVMMREGYSAEGHTGYTLQMVKRDEGTLWQPAGDIHQAVFNFAEISGSTTIYLRETTIEYPGTGAQKYIENNTQEELEAQQKRLEIIAAEARRLNPDSEFRDPSKKL